MAGTVLHFHQPEHTATLRKQQMGGRGLWRVFAGFWLLGLINNSAYVIMIAGANEIAASAVGLVYFCAIGPTIIVKLTAPYWFHLVPYTVRFWVAALLMAASFCIVALSSSTTAQLLGVALVAVQGGLGEASALGLCSLHPSQLSLTAWSSGTGFAGIMGYAWVAVLHYWLQLSYTTTLLIATGMPAVWLVVVHSLMQLSKPGSKAGPQYMGLPSTADDGREALLRPDSSLSSSNSSAASRVTSPEVELSSPASSAPDTDTDTQQQQQQQYHPADAPTGLHSLGQPRSSPSELRVALRRISSSSKQAGQPSHQQLSDRSVVVHVSAAAGGSSSSRGPGVAYHAVGADAGTAQDSGREGGVDAQHMTALQRLRATCALWPYMVPLFVVYFAEYAMQSGTWTAVGFPVTSPQARQKFYIYSNWLYQAGVCISRSSGMLFQANRVVLWIMPVLQCMLLVFFAVDAVTHVWWNWGLLCLCFAAGLLGGAVYVNSFTLLTHEVEPRLKEFSLSAACVADSFGIAAADITAIFIQGCLFKLQGLNGAAYKCEALTL